MLDILEITMIIAMIMLLPLGVAFMFKNVKGFWFALSYIVTACIALQFPNAQYVMYELLNSYFTRGAYDCTDIHTAKLATVVLITPIALVFQVVFNFMIGSYYTGHAGQREESGHSLPPH